MSADKTVASTRALSGSEVLAMFQAATSWLQRHVNELNAINVFPIPDGDTGTNMYLTMKATMEGATVPESASAAEALKAMTRAALMGARGNGGVILSQIIRGWAAPLADAEHLTAAGLVAALREGAAAGYQAVHKPVEGTILTVARDAAAAAERHLQATADKDDIVSLLQAVVREAKHSVERTPSLLPVLAEAGVVDAGGKGLAILLEGALRYLLGETTEAPAITAQRVEDEWLAVTERLHETGDQHYGYCTEFLISGRDLDVESVRQHMTAMGDSVLVVGSDDLIRVHLHTDDPGAAISYGTNIGSLSRIKVDNMEEQFRELAAARHSAEMRRAERQETPPIATVAVCTGAGMARIFRSLGATQVLDTGRSMKPSAQEIIDAIRPLASDKVIVLTNHKDVIMAAEQAQSLITDKEVAVVRTITMPQGVLALLALQPDKTLDENATLMEEASRSVRTIEIGRAVRSTSVGGVAVREGQYIAVIDGQLSLAEATAPAAVMAALQRPNVTENASLITLYYGEEATREDAEALLNAIQDAYPQIEVELVQGGQPFYAYILSVE